MESFITAIIRYKRFIAAAVALVIIVLIILNVVIFRVTSYSPSLDNMPSAARLIRINFTQPIKSIEGVEVADEKVFPEDIKIKGNSVYITVPSKGLKDGALTSLRFTKVTSQWFNFSLGKTIQRFTPKYIPFNQLSEDQQQAIVAASNSGQSDDPFLNNNFPIRTDEYSIEATKDSSSTLILVTITFAKDIPNYDVSPQATGVSNEEAERLRDKALATIRQKGGNPDKYSITYTNLYLSEKYTYNLND
jgi:hypothetical protein